MKRTGLFLLSVVVLLAMGACEDTDPTVPETTYYLAEEHGFDVGRLFHGLDLARNSGTVLGVVVERHDTVVAEAYAPGVPHWSLFETWHVTGAVTSLLVGHAIDQGYLEGLDLTLGELLVPWDHHMDEEKAGITLRQLITMTSGVSRPSGSPEEYFTWLNAPDQVAWVLEHPLRTPPGERYYLDSAAAHLLSAALTQATGRTLGELAQEVMWDPLGVPYTDWMADANGNNYGGFGLRIRTRDLVKVARLVLNSGRWKGTSVVPSAWVAEATRPHLYPYPDYPEWGFGYLWKIATCAGHPCLYASGYGGQLLVAVPGLDLAIAVNSAFSDDQTAAALHSDNAWGIVLGHIIPAAR